MASQIQPVTQQQQQQQQQTMTPPVASQMLPAGAPTGTTNSPGNAPAQIPRKSRWSWLPWVKPLKPNDDKRFENFVVEKSLRDQYPRGYPRVAAYVSADIDSRLYRGFSYLRNRLLLHRQDEIVCFQDRLLAMDKEYNSTGRANLLRSRRRDEQTMHCPRKRLFDDLEKAMEVYDDLLLREHQIMSLQKPSERQHQSLINFIWNVDKNAVGDDKYKQLRNIEYEFLNRKDDLVLLGSQEDAWLGSSVAAMKHLIPRKLRNVMLATAEDRATSRDSYTVDLDNNRTGTFVKAVICATTTLLLVLPIAVLYILSVHGASGGTKIGILLVFVVLFAFAVATMTNATRDAMFGASAAYCAVLIVFLTYSGG